MAVSLFSSVFGGGSRGLFESKPAGTKLASAVIVTELLDLKRRMHLISNHVSLTSFCVSSDTHTHTHTHTFIHTYIDTHAHSYTHSNTQSPSTVPQMLTHLNNKEAKIFIFKIGTNKMCKRKSALIQNNKQTNKHLNPW